MSSWCIKLKTKHNKTKQNKQQPVQNKTKKLEENIARNVAFFEKIIVHINKTDLF